MFSYCNGWGTSTKFSGIYPTATVIKFRIKWEIIPCIFDELEGCFGESCCVKRVDKDKYKGWMSRKFP